MDFLVNGRMFGSAIFTSLLEPGLSTFNVQQFKTEELLHYNFFLPPLAFLLDYP